MPKIIATTADGRTREFWPEQYAVACDWLNTQQPHFADKGFARFGAVLAMCPKWRPPGRTRQDADAACGMRNAGCISRGRARASAS